MVWKCERKALLARAAVHNAAGEGVKAMEGLLSSAANYGFPMVVASYLLVRIEGKLAALDRSIQELTRVVAHQR